MGLTAACFGLGGTTSNFFGQLAVEKLGHVASLTISLFISFIPIFIFGRFMPETLNTRDRKQEAKADAGESESSSNAGNYGLMA